MLVFLSYKWEDREYANGMDGLLKNKNNRYRHLTERERIDLRDQGERVWKDYLRDIIRECDAIICLIGQDTHNAGGVIYELDVALSLQKKILPVRIPDTTGGSPKSIQKLEILNWNVRAINNELSKI